MKILDCVKKSHFNTENAGMHAGMFLAAFLAAFPVLLLFSDTLQAFLTESPKLLTFLIPDTRRIQLLGRSIGISAVVALCSMAGGILTASFFCTLKSRAGLIVRVAFLATAAVPPYVHAISWSSALIWLNSLLRENGMGEILLQGNGVCIWVGMMTFLPITTGLALVGLESVEPALIEAGCIFTGGGRVFARVVLPLAAPSFIAGGAFAFLISLMEYTIPSLFQVNVYSLELFAQYSADYDAVKAFLLSLPLLLCAIPAAMLLQWAFRNAALQNTRKASRNTCVLELPVVLVLFQGLAMMISLFQFSVPIISLIVSTGSPVIIGNAFLSSYQEMGFSMKTSLLAAGITVLFGTIAALGINRHGRLFKIYWIFILLPFAVPAPLTGIALARAWNYAGVAGVGGSSWLTVMAGIIRFLPFAALIMLAVIKRIDPQLVEASRIQQKNIFHGLVKVLLPMLSKGIAAAICLVFVLVTGELGAALIVTPPGRSTITMKIYNYLHYGASDTVAALCLIMLGFSVIAGALAFYILLHHKNSARRKG